MMPEDENNFASQFKVSRETIDRLKEFVALLTKWNAAINLVSKDSISQIWSRHMVDSAQIFSLAANVKLWADLGSGGGFPGVVIAILAAEMDPDMNVVLVESDQRKAAFLRQTCINLGLSTEISSERIEKIHSLQADVISARALAPLPQLCEFTRRHLAPDGRAIFLKGRSYQAEIAAARESWNFSLETHASITDPASIILVLRGIVHV